MHDRIAAAATAVDQLATRRSGAKRARSFQERAEALRKPAEQLGQHCQTLRLLRKHGAAVPISEDLPRSLRGQAAAIAQQFTADAESILNADLTRSNTFWKPLAGYAGQVEINLKQGWSEWVGAALPAGETELLGVLDKFPSFREPVHVIRTAGTEAKRLAADLPTADDAFAAVLRLADEMDKAWARLNGAHVSPAVLTFVKKAAAREATLADYTAEVLKWVQENDLLQSFQITVGGK